MAELITLPNIGKEIEKKLKSVGIASAEELKEVGSKEAYMRLKSEYPQVCLVHLYALEGAISDTEYNQLSRSVKQNLKDYNDSFKYGQDSKMVTS